jgi:hypothetical protein
LTPDCGPGAAQVFAADEALEDVLVFPAGTDLHAHPLVRAGAVLLQVRGRGGL